MLLEAAHLGAEVEARQHPQAGQRLADVVRVALVEVGLRHAPLRLLGDRARARQRSRDVRRADAISPGRAAARPVRAAGARRPRSAWRRRSSEPAAAGRPRRDVPRSRSRRAPCPPGTIAGQLGRRARGPRDLVGLALAAGRSRRRAPPSASCSATVALGRLDHLVAALRAHQVASHRVQVRRRSAGSAPPSCRTRGPSAPRARAAGRWPRGSAAPASRAGWPSAGRRCEESGFRQITRSRPRPASRSRFDAEHTPPST